MIFFCGWEEERKRPEIKKRSGLEYWNKTRCGRMGRFYFILDSIVKKKRRSSGTAFLTGSHLGIQGPSQMWTVSEMMPFTFLSTCSNDRRRPSCLLCLGVFGQTELGSETGKKNALFPWSNDRHQPDRSTLPHVHLVPSCNTHVEWMAGPSVPVLALKKSID